VRTGLTAFRDACRLDAADMTAQQNAALARASGLNDFIDRAPALGLAAVAWSYVWPLADWA